MSNKIIDIVLRNELKDLKQRIESLEDREQEPGEEETDEMKECAACRRKKAAARRRRRGKSQGRSRSRRRI